MIPLKQRLKEENPELFYALENSWRIAENEWLPALAPSKDSYNSFPHIRNLENHLNKIIIECENVLINNETVNSKLLNSIEIYMILSAILFHDIGRINADKYHGTESRCIIEKSSGYLGIQSAKLAESIGRICEYHDTDKDHENELLKTLVTIIIDPYDKIRELELASLLVLCDCMDNAFTRVLPEYIKEDKDKEIKASFRKNIQGVYFEPLAQMVVTEIGEIKNREGDNYQSLELKPTVEWKKICSKNNKIKEILDKKLNKNGYLSLSQSFNPADIGMVKNEIVSFYQDFDKLIINNGSNINNLLLMIVGKVEFNLNELLVLCNLVYIERNKKASSLPAGLIIAIILADTLKNNNQLLKIRDQLAIIGIKIRCWLIEYKNHLFNSRGEETFEPIFHKDYLKNIIKEMWQLSSQVFGNCYFSYDTLASAVREPNVELIKLAVRRISIITKNARLFDDEGVLTDIEIISAIWAGDNHWKWIVEKCDDKKYKRLVKSEKKHQGYRNNSALCRYENGLILGAERLYNIIDCLGNPFNE